MLIDSFYITVLLCKCYKWYLSELINYLYNMIDDIYVGIINNVVNVAIVGYNYDCGCNI